MAAKFTNEFKADTIANKLHIKPQHIILVEGFCRSTSTLIQSFHFNIPSLITDVTLFYYAKPLKMKMKHQKIIKYILYCPINDSWDSIITKISHIFNINHSLLSLNYHKNSARTLTVRKSSWENLKWNENTLFTTQRRTPTKFNKYRTTQLSLQKIDSIKYTIMTQISKFDNTYKCLNTQTLKVNTIKIFSKQDINTNDQHNIISNINLLTSLPSHANVVSYIDLIQNDTYIGIISEYCDLGSLEHFTKIYIETDHEMIETIVATYIKQMLLGLEFLHSQGIIHGNVRAANVQLTNPDGVAKLSDWGLNIMETDTDTDTIAVSDCVYWTAPEILEMTLCNSTESAADIWSVGATAIELFTGYPPYYTLQPMNAMLRMVSDMHPDFPENASDLFKEFLSLCFIKNVKERPCAKKLISHKWLRDDIGDDWSSISELELEGIYVVNRDDIDLKYIVLVHGYSRESELYIPFEIVDVVLFYYAKPFVITLKYDNITKCVLYSPVKHTFDLLMRKVKKIFHEHYLYLRHKNYKRQIKKTHWNDIDFHTNMDYMFDVESSSEWEFDVESTDSIPSSSSNLLSRSSSSSHTSD